MLSRGTTIEATPNPHRGTEGGDPSPMQSALVTSSFDYALIAFSKKALSKLRKESRPCVASLQCFTSQGAGTQHPIHFSCAPARSRTMTANSKESATRQTQQQQTAKQARQSKQQTAQQSQPAPPKPTLQHPPAVLPRSTYTRGNDGEG